MNLPPLFHPATDRDAEEFENWIMEYDLDDRYEYDVDSDTYYLLEDEDA